MSRILSLTSGTTFVFRGDSYDVLNDTKYYWRMPEEPQLEMKQHEFVTTSDIIDLDVLHSLVSQLDFLPAKVSSIDLIVASRLAAPDSNHQILYVDYNNISLEHICSNKTRNAVLVESLDPAEMSFGIDYLCLIRFSLGSSNLPDICELSEIKDIYTIFQQMTAMHWRTGLLQFNRVSNDLFAKLLIKTNWQLDFNLNRMVEDSCNVKHFGWLEGDGW